MSTGDYTSLRFLFAILGINECNRDVTPNYRNFTCSQCDLMWRMKALVAGLALLISGISTTQALHPRQKNTKTQCGTILKVDSTLYAETKSEKIDSVTVCDDGKTTAFHSFTAPSFGAAQAEPTKWAYKGEMDKDALSDLKKVIRRPDVVRLPDRVNAIKTPSSVDVLMRFTIFDQGAERTIELHIPSIACGEDRPEFPGAIWDLICLFTNLYDRTKTDTPSPENNCGCRSLHEMAVAQQAGLQ